jgi:phosphatidate cytidylyltransferase
MAGRPREIVVSEWDEGEADQLKTPAEGVRIIGPEEAADAARRRRLDGPQGGRRSRERSPQHGGPGSAAPEERPAFRFPLDASEDPDLIERPRAAPTDHHRPPTEVPHWRPSAVEEVPNMPRDPYEGDESAAWSSYSGQAPRWREDAPGGGGQGGYDPRRAPQGGGRGPAGAPGQAPPGQAPPGQGQPGYEDEYDDPSPGRSVFDAAGPGAETYEDSYRDQSYDADVYADEEYDEVYDDTYDDEYVDDQGYAEAPPRGAPSPRRGGSRKDSRRSPARGGTGGRDMPVAIGVGAGLAVAALVLFQIGPAAAMVLVTAVLGVASYEYFTATQRAGFDPLLPVGVAATVAAALVAYNYGDAVNRGESAVLVVLALTVVVSLVWYLIDAGGERPMANVGATLLGVLWVGLFGSYAGLLLAAPNGIALLLAAVIPTIGYDVVALFVGSSARSPHPLSSASPNKTIEGLVGGMVGAVVAAVLLGAVGPDPFTLGDGFKIGIVVALVAPLGDLSESLIKRDLGIKDMGTILPGHGGVLDRFDALLFVLPAVWYLARVSDFFLL